MSCDKTTISGEQRDSMSQISGPNGHEICTPALLEERRIKLELRASMRHIGDWGSQKDLQRP